MSAAIELVAWDLGNVLVAFDPQEVIRQVARHSEGGIEAVTHFVMKSPWLERYERGQISTEEIFQRFQKECGYRGTLTELAEDLTGHFSEIRPMVRLLRWLKGQGYRCCAFSNTNPLAIERIRQFSFWPEFDFAVLSYEHGAMKPEPRLYEVVEDQGHCQGSQILYFDDRPENVATGRQRGWIAIHHQNIEGTFHQLRQLGLLPRETAFLIQSSSER